MANFSSLPREVVLKILSHLGTPKDIATCSRLSQDLHDATKAPQLWRELAIRKYGLHIAEATIHLYGGNWKGMLEDDNSQGAAPTIRMFKPCLWKFNNNAHVQQRLFGGGEGLFYCCIITGIQWQRANGTVRVYFDARGESDLRDPRRSTIKRPNEPLPRLVFLDRSSFVRISSLVWRNGHFKGYMIFDQAMFQEDETYTFCYANFFHNRQADYEVIPLLTGKLDGAMFDHYTLNEYNLFGDETEEMELARWKKVLPEGFLESRPEWWV